MKRKPTPAQIAARERFAEMARSGAFKRSKGKRKKNPLTYGLDGVVNITDTYERSVASSRGLAEHYANQLRMRGRDDIVYVVFGITPEAKTQAGRLRNGVTITLNPRDYEIAYAFHPTRGEISRELKTQRDAERRAYTRQGMTLKRNPAKKTVSQKISQLTREGYPQKQAVAIALSEQRAGKVKRNPAQSMQTFEIIDTTTGESEGFYKAADAQLAFEVWARSNGYKSFSEMKQKEKFGARGRFIAVESQQRKRNPRASNPIILVSDKPKRVTRKSNPAKPKRVKVQRPFYYVVKVGSAYDGQFLSTHYSLEDVKKIAQQKADKYGAQAKITEFHM